jgi:hypothetical protein
MSLTVDHRAGVGDDDFETAEAVDPARAFGCAP